jgi:hypothetical protein
MLEALQNSGKSLPQGLIYSSQASEIKPMIEHENELIQKALG